jgi:hypothetical protein
MDATVFRARLLWFGAVVAVLAHADPPVARADGVRDVRMEAPLGLLDAGERVRLAVRTSGRAARFRAVLSPDRGYDATDVALRRLRVVARNPRRARIRAVVPRAAPVVPLRLVVCARPRGSKRQRCRTRRGRLVVTDGTSMARIAGAAALGRLSKDREIRYELQAAFMPGELPRRIRGKRSPGFNSATPILADVVAQWDRLSAATRALATPYLVPPVYESEGTGSMLSRRQVAPYTTLPCTALDMEPRILHKFRWGSADAFGLPAVVHWLHGQRDNAAIARKLASELSSRIWPKLMLAMTGATGVPPSVIPDSGPCAGWDGRLDIYVVEPKGQHANKAGYARKFGTCGTAGPSYIVINPADAQGAILAHEFMHVLLNTYTIQDCANYSYLHEAVSDWAMGVAYPDDKYRFSMDGMLTNASAWFGAPDDDSAGYHGWPFIDAITRRMGHGVVHAAFSHAWRTDSYTAMNWALGGRLADEWAHFAALALNERFGAHIPESFAQWYPKWNVKLTVAPTELRLRKDKRRTTKLPTALVGMGRQYYDLRILDKPSKTRYVALDNLGALQKSPTFRSIIYYQTATRFWHREDLTSVPRREFCRDLPSTSVNRVVIVNSITQDPGKQVESTKPSVTLAQRCPRAARPKPANLPCQPNGCAIEVLGVSGRESWSATTLSGPSWDQCTTTASATHTYNGGAANAAGLLEIRDESVEVRLKERHYYLPELALRAPWARLGSGEETRRCHDTISNVTETTVCAGQGSSSTGEVEAIGVTPDDAYELDRLAATIEVELTHLISTLFVPGTITGYERTPPDPNPDSPVGQECSVDATGPLISSSEGQSTTPTTRISTQALLSGQAVTATTTTTQTIGDSSASWNLSVTFRLAAAGSRSPS